MIWLKKYWQWVVGAVAAVMGLIIAILTLGQVRQKPPARPKTPDVKIPDTKPVNTTPADEYERGKTTKVDDVAASINERYR